MSRGHVAVVLAALAVVATGVGHARTSARPAALRVVFESDVSRDPAGVYVEPTVAVDPRDPNRMAAAAIHFRSPRSEEWQDRQTVVAFVSHDGGRSWRRRALGGLPSAWAAGDPWLAWGEGDRVYLSAVVAEALTRRGAVSFAGVFTSDDGGVTWSGPLRPFPAGTHQDHPVISARTGAGVAIAGTIADGTGEGVYVGRAHGGTGLDSARVQRIEPGWSQVNLGGAVLLDDGAVALTHYTMRPPRRYAARRIEADGRPGRETILADDILPLGFPPVATQPAADRVYALWPEGPEPAIALRLAYSEDGGATWTRGGSIEAGAASALRTLPALAVSGSGAVATVWQEFTREGSCTNLHGAVSTDGGRSFGPPTRLSAAASCFATRANGAAVNRFRLGGGDYIGLAPAGDDAFQAVWADSRGGTFQIRTARLVVTGS